MLRKSSNSVVIKCAERDDIEQAVSRYLRDLFEKHPEVARVIWFGSWVTGIGPGSDVDLFPCTEAELAAIERDGPGWYRCLTTGREVTRRNRESGWKRARALGEQG